MMGAKAVLESAESAYENGEPDRAIALVSEYRGLRSAGAEEPRFPTGRGDSLADTIEQLARLAVLKREIAADAEAAAEAERLAEVEQEARGIQPAAIGFSAPTRKRPKKKRGKNPPVSGINRAALKGALGLYRKFREAEPKRLRKVTIEVPKALMTMGRVSAIEYETTHGGKTHAYRHDFVPGSRPTLAATGKKQGLFLLGGRYHVTERGIVDLDPKGREVEDNAGEVIRSEP